MGRGWRHISESFKQRVISDGDFKPTSNARNAAMFREATEFTKVLRVLERDLRNIHKEIGGNFSNMKQILLTPLPRAYEEGQNGAVPCTEESRAIGQGVQVDNLVQASAELAQHLEDDVFKPLRSWLHAYKALADRMEVLEKLRLEVDSRRRTVDGLGQKLNKMLETQPPPQQKAKHDQEIEKAAVTLKHKQEKLKNARASYSDLERTVFSSLNTLIKDTGVFRDYAGLSLQLVQECFQKGHAAFSSATPLLEYNSTSENLFRQGFYGENLPVLEKANSERGAMIHQLTSAPSSKGPERPASAYGMAEDGGDLPYGMDQQQQYGMDKKPYGAEPQHGYGGDQKLYGMDQQMGAMSKISYADVAPQMGPAGVLQNPYQYTQSPNAARYMPPQDQGRWNHHHQPGGY